MNALMLAEVSFPKCHMRHYCQFGPDVAGDAGDDGYVCGTVGELGNVFTRGFTRR